MLPLQLSRPIATTKLNARVLRIKLMSGLAKSLMLTLKSGKLSTRLIGCTPIIQACLRRLKPKLKISKSKLRMHLRAY